MRVLYVARSYGVHDRRFVEAWQSQGVDVLAVAADGTAPGQSDDGADLSQVVAHAVVAHRPGVVHAGPLTDVAAVVAEEWHGPLIATSWGFDLMDDVGRDPELRRTAAEVVRRADVVHVDNDAAAVVARELGAGDDALVQFPWGIDLERFRPGPGRLRQELGWEGCAVVLSSRRHERLYRVDVVVRAFVEAAADAPALRLLLAGSGSQSADLLAELDRAGLRDRVHVAGELGQDDLGDAYRSADLYVSMSTTDGSSISLLEAVACGTPVCVSDIPGNRQWVTPETGQTVPLSDVATLADRLRELADPDPAVAERRQDRATAASRLVHRDADWTVNRRVLRRAGDLAVARAQVRT